jgi:hypothetical protein
MFLLRNRKQDGVSVSAVYLVDICFATDMVCEMGGGGGMVYFLVRFIYTSSSKGDGKGAHISFRLEEFF